jgi:hypothetical protein
LAVIVLLVKTLTRAVDGNLFGGISLVGENTNKGCGKSSTYCLVGENTNKGCGNILAIHQQGRDG